MSQDVADPDFDWESWVKETHAWALSAAQGGNYDGALDAWRTLIERQALTEDGVRQAHWNIGMVMAAQAGGDERGEQAALSYLVEHGWDDDSFQAAKTDGIAPA